MPKSDHATIGNHDTDDSEAASVASPSASPSSSPSSSSRSQLAVQLAELEGHHNNMRLMGNGKGRRKLFPKHKHEFDSAAAAAPSLFGDFAQAVCEASCIPRKELFEAWAMACHVQHHFPTATRFADLASGHGLLGWALLVLTPPTMMTR